MPHADDARVVVYVRQECHLCDVAVAVVTEVCDQTQSTWVTIDIDENASLRTAFTDQVPVTFVDGKQHDFWRVDARRLSAALAV